MLTEDEKSRARHHLGYLQVTSAQTFVLGVPAAVQTTFMIEGALNKLLPSGESKFRSILDNLDGVEAQIIEDQENLAVDQIDTIKVRPDEFKHLMIRYEYWRSGLANLLGIIPNPFDQRAYIGRGFSGVNVPVS